MSEQREPQELTEQDLEKYGVWVKAGPEDVVDEVDSGDTVSLSDYEAEPSEGADLSGEADLQEADLDIDLEDLSLEPDHGTPAVDDLGELDDLGFEESEKEKEAGSVELESATPEEEAPADLGGEILDQEEPGAEELEDFNLEDLDFEVEEEGGSEEPSDEAESIDLEEELAAETTSEEEDLASLEAELDEEDFDLGEEEDFSNLEEELQAEEAPREEEEQKMDLEGEVVTLDDLGIEEPEEETDPFAELPEEEEETEEEEPEEIGEVDLSELEEETEESIPGMEGDFEDLAIEEEEEEEGFGAEELPELEAGEHDFTPEEAGIDIESPETPLNRLTSEEEDFFDEGDQGEGLPKEGAGDIHTPSGGQPMDVQDREALQEITKELHEIRSELADLKRVLSSGAATAAAGAPAATAPEAEEEEAPAGGFFDEEDEDETIALTGDELDNILNTAEFTEEAGQAAEFEDESEFYLGGGAQPAAEAPTQEAPAGEAPPAEAPEEEPPVEEISLEEIDEEEPAEAPAAEAPEEEEWSQPEAGPAEDESSFEFGDESQVDELAQLDIESELADVDELKDEEDEEEEDLGEVDFDEIELGEEAQEEEAQEEEAEEEETPEVEAETSEFGPEGVTEEDLLEEEQAEEVPGSPEEFAAHFDQMEKEEAAGDFEEEAPATTPESSLSELPDSLKAEIRSVLTYMDQLLEALPEEKIQEFAESEHFEVYRRLFEELGIDT